MYCKNHPNREAENICKGCGIPICTDCAEESKPGEYYCFQCAMLYSVSDAGTAIVDKKVDRREKAAEKLEKKKKWGPFYYFVFVSLALILVMWGVIIFGGKKAPSREMDYAKNQRVFIFMVDSAVKRYAHYEGKKYPKELPDIIPKYLSLREDQLHYLDIVSYERDPEEGYRLSLTNPKPGEMNIIIFPKGIKYESS